MKQKEKPLITVITPTYNSIKTIKKTADSLYLNNSYIYEWIVVDSSSSDGTIQYLNALNIGVDIKIIKDGVNGVYAAMNVGIQYASGEIISILNSDDYWSSSVGKKVTECFINNLGLDIVYGVVTLIDGESENKICTIGDSSFSIIDRFRLNEVHPSVFVRARVYKKIGIFDTKYPINADLDFLLRAFVNNVYCLFNEEINVYYREGGISSQLLPRLDTIVRMYVHNKPSFSWFLFTFTRLCYAKITRLSKQYR